MAMLVSTPLKVSDRNLVIVCTASRLMAGNIPMRLAGVPNNSSWPALRMQCAGSDGFLCELKPKHYNY